MEKYKIKHDNKEIQIIYSISDNRETQRKLMSLLSYTKKYSIDGVLKYSVNKLYKMYLRSHEAITRSYFYKLMTLIKEHFYTLVEDTFEDTFEDKIEVTQTVDTTSLEGDFKKHNNKIKNNNTYTITDNTNYSQFVSPTKLIEIARDLLKEYAIKSKSVKHSVELKLTGINNILATGAVAYVTRVIADKKAEQEARRQMYYNLVGVYKEQKVGEKQAYQDRKNKERIEKKWGWLDQNLAKIQELEEPQVEWDYEELHRTGVLI